MTQEEKSLLLQDLCSRLPYGVMVYTDYDTIDCPILLKELSYDGDYYAVGGDYTTLRGIIFNNHPCKPYLRPMSSMTEEEIKDYHKCTDAAHRECYEVRANGEDRKVIIGEDGYSSAVDLDWLNAHHFDYRGLIEKGLALEAPKDMYKAK